MPRPLPLPSGVEKVGRRWTRRCPTCNTRISHLRRNYCIHAHAQRQPCKLCSNRTNHPAGLVGPVRQAWFNSFRKSALTRGYAWELTIEDIVALYTKQNGRCALTNWPIAWSATQWNHTASIDRIDNTRGYTQDNIQLVHKTANMARGTLTLDHFTYLCHAVANKVKW